MALTRLHRTLFRGQEPSPFLFSANQADHTRTTNVVSHARPSCLTQLCRPPRNQARCPLWTYFEAPLDKSEKAGARKERRKYLLPYVVGGTGPRATQMRYRQHLSGENEDVGRDHSNNAAPEEVHPRSGSSLNVQQPARDHRKTG